MTMVVPGRSVAGSWYVRLLPPPVGATSSRRPDREQRLDRLALARPKPLVAETGETCGQVWCHRPARTRRHYLPIFAFSSISA